MERLSDSSLFVSVIVPNYNYARYLPQRLDSIFNQTYRNFELIILDDCSTDNSREVIESYRSNPHVSCVVYNEKNSGSTFKQWKKGLDYAKGDLIWIAEADDYADPLFLECFISIFQKNQSVGMAYCYSVLVDESSSLIEEPDLIYCPEWEKISLFSGVDFIMTHLSRETNPKNVSSALFTRDALMDAFSNPLFIEMKSMGDRMAYILISEQSNIVYVNEKLNYFRRSRESVTPTQMYNGTTMREIYLIDSYLRKNRYLVGWNSLLTWCNRFKQIYVSNFNSEQTRAELLHLYDPIGIMSRPLLKILSFIAVSRHNLVKLFSK